MREIAFSLSFPSLRKPARDARETRVRRREGAWRWNYKRVDVVQYRYEESRSIPAGALRRKVRSGRPLWKIANEVVSRSSTARFFTSSHWFGCWIGKFLSIILKFLSLVFLSPVFLSLLPLYWELEALHCWLKLVYCFHHSILISWLYESIDGTGTLLLMLGQARIEESDKKFY